MFALFFVVVIVFHVFSLPFVCFPLPFHRFPCCFIVFLGGVRCFSCCIIAFQFFQCYFRSFPLLSTAFCCFSIAFHWFARDPGHVIRGSWKIMLLDMLPGPRYDLVMDLPGLPFRCFSLFFQLIFAVFLLFSPAAPWIDR